MNYRDLYLSFKAFGLSWLLREKVPCISRTSLAPLINLVFCWWLVAIFVCPGQLGSYLRRYSFDREFAVVLFGV